MRLPSLDEPVDDLAGADGAVVLRVCSVGDVVSGGCLEVSDGWVSDVAVVCDVPAPGPRVVAAGHRDQECHQQDRDQRGDDRPDQDLGALAVVGTAASNVGLAVLLGPVLRRPVPVPGYWFLGTAEFPGTAGCRGTAV